MPGRPGPRVAIQAATTYTVSTWTACSTTIKLDGDANTLILYVSSAVDSIGNTDFYVEHSPNAGTTYYLYSSDSESPKTWGPLPFTAASQNRSIVLGGLEALAGETIKVYFRCDSAASGATIAITAEAIYAASGASLTLGDVEVELESLSFAEDTAHATGDVGIMALATRNDYGVARSGTDGDYTPLATDSAGRLKVLTSGNADIYSVTQSWAGSIASGGSAVTIDINAALSANSKWLAIYCDGAGTIDVDFELQSKVAGTHTGANDAAVLTDSTANWRINSLAGRTITNVTDGSTGTITSNTATTITGPLTGGTGNDWDASDSYTISAAYVPTTPHVLRSGEVLVVDCLSVDTLRLDDNAADTSYRVLAFA